MHNAQSKQKMWHTHPGFCLQKRCHCSGYIWALWRPKSSVSDLPLYFTSTHSCSSFGKNKFNRLCKMGWSPLGEHKKNTLRTVELNNFLEFVLFQCIWDPHLNVLKGSIRMTKLEISAMIFHKNHMNDFYIENLVMQHCSTSLILSLYTTFLWNLENTEIGIIRSLAINT